MANNDDVAIFAGRRAARIVNHSFGQALLDGLVVGRIDIVYYRYFGIDFGNDDFRVRADSRAVYEWDVDCVAAGLDKGRDYPVIKEAEQKNQDSYRADAQAEKY